MYLCVYIMREKKHKEKIFMIQKLIYHNRLYTFDNSSRLFLSFNNCRLGNRKSQSKFCLAIESSVQFFKCCKISVSLHTTLFQDCYSWLKKLYCFTGQVKFVNLITKVLICDGLPQISCVLCIQQVITNGNSQSNSFQSLRTNRAGSYLRFPWHQEE